MFMGLNSDVNDLRWKVLYISRNPKALYHELIRATLCIASPMARPQLIDNITIN